MGLHNPPEIRCAAKEITRALDAASGDVSYTGFGFAPKAIIIIGSINNTTSATIGIAAGTGTSSGRLRWNDSGSASQADETIAYHQTAAGANQQATLKSLDSDGFTLTWTKTGAPAGTGTMFVIAFG